MGGSGLIGRAVARRLLSSGWNVDITGRNPSNVPADLTASGAAFHAADRSDTGALRHLVGSGADLLVDCLCFTAADALHLLPFLGDVGSSVMLSSKAVYVDSFGRPVNSPDRPVFSGPVSEDQPTVAPGNGYFDSPEGYGRNKVAAEHVLLDSGHPVTVLRASKVHGEGASPAREWVFVRRVLDARKAVLLTSSGSGVDHTTAAVNVAALVERIAANPGSRILNSADPDAPSALEISRVVAAYFGHRWEEILLAGGSGSGGRAGSAGSGASAGSGGGRGSGGAAPGERGSAQLGAHPWESAAPIILDTRASLELGYVPVGDYAATVQTELDWLSRSADDPASAAGRLEFFNRYVDYAAEDRFMSERR
ncbi:reductase [Arthrobacter sp. zg-Y1219]|uniref:NAD-dependent epimerase/dehydratase family protein n=1 Tax=Arthrobacter sp. zg-Y1219 TaxID=3049067 RepID=UPI0024C2D45C|nr:NAD-dependent epimerase/dehydratase family protein [Arthrobacter sp. zg-Y1219]MDK1361074.1 reductase [Arthrobacter sp. zg-Y1219]